MKIAKKDTRPPVKVNAALLAREYDLLTVQAMKSGYSTKEMAEVVLRTWLGTGGRVPPRISATVRLELPSTLILLWLCRRDGRLRVVARLV
jgi:hypothetical protein